MSDPRPAYADLREARVACSSAHGGFAVVARHADVRAAAEECGVFSSRALSIPGGPGSSAPIMVDPPDHVRYRTVLSRLLSREATLALAAQITSLVRDLASALQTGDEVEASTAFAEPLAVGLLVRAMGLDHDDEGRLQRWADILVFREHPDRATGVLASRQLADYFATATMHPALRDADLTAEERINLCLTVFYAALGPIRHVTNSALALLEDGSSVRSEILAAPDRDIAVEEFFRFVSPVQSIGRVVTDDADRFGHSFLGGERVLLVWGSANQDPTVFDNPSAFHADRVPNPHLAFGAGIHRCPGALLSRVAIGAVVDELLDRLPPYRVRSDGLRRQFGHTCGLSRVPLSFL